MNEVQHVATAISAALGEPLEMAKQNRRDYLFFVARAAIKAVREFDAQQSVTGFSDDDIADIRAGEAAKQ